ncbi:MAG TPA: hypothetical protein VFX16_03220 [Pseudonocardiaceae bacterium]|nr:hypothetical protein [Pseudonocardiaceae bacterium]
MATDPEHLFLNVDSCLRVTWCWIEALTGHDPASAAAEAEHIVDTRLVDPPQLGVEFHFGLVVDMYLAAGDTELAGAALARAEWFPTLTASATRKVPPAAQGPAATGTR